MRHLPFVGTLAILLFSSAGQAESNAAPEKSDKPNVAIPTIPSLPVAPDNIVTQLKRTCGAVKELTFDPKTQLDKFDPAAVETALKTHPTLPKDLNDALVMALGNFNVVCRDLNDGKVTLTEAFWKDLQKWRDQPSTWVDNLVKGAEIVRSKKLGDINHESLPGVGSLASGDFQAMVLNGVADFLVTRAKAEAALYLREQLKESLCSDANSAYVPATCAAVIGLDEKISFNAAGAYLQAAARRDLELLPLRMLRAKSPKSQPASAALLTLMVFQQARQGRQPLDLVTNLDGVTCDAKLSPAFEPEVAKAVCQASRLLRVVRSLGTDVNKDLYGTQYYAVGAALKVEEILGAMTSPIELSFAQVSRITAGINNAAKLVREVESLANEIAKPVPIPSPIAAGGGVGKTFGTKDKARLVAQTVSTLAEYASLIECGDATKCKVVTELKEAQAVADFGTALFAGDIGDAVTAGSDLMLRMNITLPAGVSNVLPLLTEIANAKSSKDVSTALEAAVSPVGSYKAKYERRTMGINAFVGASFALELVRYDHRTEPGFAPSIFAPIGFQATAPWGTTKEFHGGAFVSLVDLGSLLSARVADETETSDVGTTSEVKPWSNVNFAQVLSPGLFLTLGLKESPVTLGLGASFTPALRNRITTDNTTHAVITSEDLTAFRAQLFIAGDLTLFPF